MASFLWFRWPLSKSKEDASWKISPSKWWKTFEKFITEQLGFDQHPMHPRAFILRALEPLEQGAR